MVNAVQLYHHLTCITNCISIYLYSLCWSRNLDGFGSVEISSMKASKSRGACVFLFSQYLNVKICPIERFPHSLNIKICSKYTSTCRHLSTITLYLCHH